MEVSSRRVFPHVRTSRGIACESSNPRAQGRVTPASAGWRPGQPDRTRRENAVRTRAKISDRKWQRLLALNQLELRSDRFDTLTDRRR